MNQSTAFGHARWRVSILGVAGLCLGALMIAQSPEMLDPAWHTDASRGMWMNHLPPLVRTLLMFGMGSLLLVIGIANLFSQRSRSCSGVARCHGETSPASRTARRACFSTGRQKRSLWSSAMIGSTVPQNRSSRRSSSNGGAIRRLEFRWPKIR